MPTRVTITNPVRSEDGLSIWLKDSVNTASDEFARYLINARGAIDTDKTSPLASATALAEPVYYAPNSMGEATLNTAAIQQRLNRGGHVAFLNPGIVWVNATLLIPSNTHIHIGAGVTIKKADGSSGGIFTNVAAQLTTAQATTVPGANISYGLGPDGSNYCGTVASTGIGAKHPLGSCVSVVVKGHIAGNSVANRFWRGVWKVVESSANNIKFETRTVTPPGSSSPTESALIYPANENISITGPGAIDGNRANISIFTYAAGDPRGVVAWFRHVRGLTLDGFAVAPGVTWTIGTNYVRDYVVRGIHGDTRGAGAGGSADLIHLSGNHQQVVVEDIKGECGDNIIGMTIDITDDPANTGNYPAFNFPFQDPGDMWEISISRVHGFTAGAAVCGLYGPPSYSYNDIVFDDISGFASAAVQLAPYVYTGMTSCVGSKLRVTNLHANCPGQQFLTVGVQNWGEIILDDINCVSVTSAPAVQLDGTGTIRRLSLRNFHYSPSNPGDVRSGPMVLISTQNVTQLEVGSSAGYSLGAGVPILSHTGAGVIDRIIYSDITAVSSASGAGAIHKSTGAGQIGSITFNSCTYTGVSSTGAMLDQGASALITTVNFNSSTVTAAAGMFVGANTTATINVFMNGVSFAGTCAYAGQFAGPTNLWVNGYSELGTMTNNPLRLLTTAKAYNLSLRGVLRTADAITFIAGANLRLTGGGDARTDGANVTAPQVGDSFWSTTVNTSGSASIGLKGRTNAAAWAGVF